MNISNCAALVDALRILSSNRDVIKDTHGNASCRSDSREIHIKPSGFPYEKIYSQNLVRISWNDGPSPKIDNSLNKLKPSVDWMHHFLLYDMFPDIGGICHTHSPYATAYAIAGKSIRCCSTEQADYFGEDIVCLPYADLNSWGRGLMRYALEKKELDKAYLLQNHGVITLGKDPLEAVRLAIEVENIAQKMFIAKQLLGPIWDVPRLPPGEIREWNLRYNTTYGQK